MLTVVNPDNTFSGVQYKEVKQEYIDYHKQYGQKLIWCERKLTFDDNDNVNEIPTENELKNEIITGEDMTIKNYFIDLDFRISLLELGL